MKVKEGLGSILILVAFGMLVGVAISFCILALAAPTEEQVSIQEEEEMEVIGLYRMGAYLSVRKIHDNRDNVTCWTCGEKGGMSCIPDHMLSP
jgi:hypothetical protein